MKVTHRFVGTAFAWVYEIGFLDAPIVLSGTGSLSPIFSGRKPM
jgi:hypothetical protein